MLKKKKGFTLIELLVVIAIIAILSTLAVIALGNARQKARDSKRQSDLKVLQTAIEMYSSDNGTAPTGLTNGWGGASPSLKTKLATYLPGGLPEDPNTGTAARDWIYCVDATGSDYMVATTLEQNIAVQGDLDTVTGWAVGECISSDGTNGTVPVCTDSNGGTIDDNATATAVCLGSDDT